MSIRASFIVASYNGAAYLGEQLGSILAALGSEDEVVVSDDGSTDTSRACVEAFGDPRIVLLPPGPRLGYQRNFARAAAATRGAFVFFSDQDDICLPARVPLSLAALAKRPCVCGDAIVVDGSLQRLHDSYFSLRRARFGAASLFLRPSVIGATLACRRGFLVANLPFPEGVPHDMWLSVQAARRGGLAVVREPFILYRRHQAALSPTGRGSTRPLGARVAERGRLLKALWRHPQAATERT